MQWRIAEDYFGHIDKIKVGLIVNPARGPGIAQRGHVDAVWNATRLPKILLTLSILGFAMTNFTQTES